MHTCSSNSPPITDGNMHHSTKVVWTHKNEVAFLEHLLDILGDNDSFKNMVFAGVAIELNKIHDTGAVKNMEVCRSKWKRVCIFFVMCFTSSANTDFGS